MGGCIGHICQWPWLLLCRRRARYSLATRGAWLGPLLLMMMVHVLPLPPKRPLAGAGMWLAVCPPVPTGSPTLLAAGPLSFQVPSDLLEQH